MSKHQKHTPKHRNARPSRLPSAVRIARSGLRRSMVLSSVAVVATGVVVGTGVASGQGNGATVVAAVAEDLASAVPTALTGDGDDVTRSPEREDQASRSDRRAAADPLKEAQLETSSSEANAVTRTEDAADGDPREIARILLPEYGFGQDQFTCLDKLYISESDWRVDADNPTSSAYGIPQALPGEKMATEGADWETNPVTQIRWGLRYIKERYGTPCSAWSFKQGNNWY